MNHEIIYDKPFKTYEQQIERLISDYGLEIKNINFAKYVLSTFSYYDLVNGYKDIFMINDKFINGTTIEYLTFFYLYDKEFQNLIFRYSLFIESAFKNKMAHIIAKDFGVAQSDYLANCHYNFAYKNKIFLYQVKSDIEKHSTITTKDGEKKYIQQPSKHYAEKHNHIPPWVLFKNITFADAISLYKLLKPQQKQQVSELMLSCSIQTKDKTAFIIPALDLIRKYRNVIAHNLKFVTYIEPKYRLPLPILKKIITDADVFKGRKNLFDIYACIIAIYILLDNPFMQANFLGDIAKVYSFKPSEYKSSNEVMSKIRDDYFVITKVQSNINEFLKYSLSSIPLKVPFQ